LVAALQANYLDPESYREENDGGEKIMETEEVESESKIVKPGNLNLKKKPDKETKKLSREEELEWIRKIRNTVLK